MKEKRIRLLFVEDDKIDQMAFERFAKKDNLPYDYTVASSISEAEEALRSQEYDVVVSDYMLGDGTAFDIFDQTKGAPLVVVTGTGNEKVAVKAMKQGAHDYIIKDPEGNYLHTLPATVELALKRKRIEKELRNYQERLESMVKERTAQLEAEIIERKEAETALLQSKKDWENTFNAINNWVSLIDRKRRVLRTNSACEEFLGLPMEEIVDQPCCKLVHGVDVPLPGCPVEKMLETGKRDVVEMQLPNGLWVEIIADPVKDKDGYIIGAVHIVVDISTRKQAEASLRESQETLVTVLDGVDAAVYVADMKTHEILFMNRHMQEDFGNDLTGEICWKAFRNESGPCDHCTNDKLLDTHGNPTGVHVWDDKNPVTGKWYINHDRAIKWVDGQFVCLQVATDITKIKELEEKRLNAEGQLQRAEKMEAVGTLAGGIAHDFNNILSSIIGYSELTMDDLEKGSPAERNLRQVLKAGNRAKDLVNQILTFSREDKQEQKPFQIKYVVKEVLKFLRASLPSTIEIGQDINSDSLLMGDSTQIYQVLMNLCTNASHAMEEKGGELDVALTDTELDSGFTATHPDLKPGPFLKITVTDTGYGIKPHVLERIFEPFFTTKQPGEGTGLGLSVVHGIVKSHGGGIYAYSEPGKGATFHVYLPAIKRESAEESETERPVPCGTERILFVDDEPMLVELGEQALKSLGYAVTTTTSSTDALALFRKQPDQFDLVITDMTMPHMTGDSLAREMIKIRPDIPVILCTGHSKGISEGKAKEMGIRAFIMKPILRRTVAETIREVL